VTEVDQKEVECPARIMFPDFDLTKSDAGPEVKGDGSYRIKDWKAHISHAENNKEEKNAAMAQRLVDKARAEELAKITKEVDKFANDRVHCWVLVKAGRRDITEDLFVEATTGLIYKVDGSPYVGIETIWSDANCWVNMQGEKSMDGLSYDLSDQAKWENVLVQKQVDEALTGRDSEPPKSAKSKGRSPKARTPKTPKSPKAAKSPTKSPRTALASEGKEDGPNNVALDTLDVPRSWTLPPNITKELYRNRFPKFCREIQYRNCLIEKYKECESKVACLVQRVTLYDPTEEDAKRVGRIIEYYRHRTDRMRKKISFVNDAKEIQLFEKGYNELQGLMELIKTPERKIYKFHPNWRKDGMLTRVWKKGTIKETFSNRDDRLTYRSFDMEPIMNKNDKKLQFVFGGDKKQKGQAEQQQQHLTKIVERYSRNPSVAAENDVEERIHWIQPGRREVQIEYHLPEDGIIRKCLVYTMKSGDTKLHENHYMTRCPPNVYKLPSKNDQFKELAFLSQKEKEIFADIRERERNAANLDKTLADEVKLAKFVKDIHDAAQDQVDYMAKEQDEREDEDNVRAEIDYLAPYLNFPNGIPQNRQNAITARNDCLQALKERLLERATIIQEHLDREQAALKSNNDKYNKHKSEDQEKKKEADDEFKRTSEEIMFRLSILENRLKRHGDMAVEQYNELKNKLKNDPRLARQNEKK